MYAFHADVYLGDLIDGNEYLSFSDNQRTSGVKNQHEQKFRLSSLTCGGGVP